METFPRLLAIWAGNSPVPGEFPSQRPVTRSFDVFFDLRLNWGNNREAGDLRRHRAHYDVIVMYIADQHLDQHLRINTCGVGPKDEFANATPEDTGKIREY